MKVIANKLFDIDKLYIMRYAFERDRDGNYYEPTDKRSINNNIIVDTSFGVLTSPDIMEKLFTPGNFDQLKRIGYSIQAARVAEGVSDVAEGKLISDLANEYDSYYLSKDRDLIKSLGYQQKNLIDFNTQVEFQRQNMVAAKLIGVFAQANVSHSLCSMLDCQLDIPKDLAFTIKEPTVGRSGGEVRRIQGVVDIDRVRGFNGERTSDNLASLLASSVDAVKDPILNLMDINIDTVNVVTTLLRLGFSLETCALICSQQCVIDIVDQYNRDNAMRTYKKSLGDFIEARLKKLNISKVDNLADWVIDYNMLKNGVFRTQSDQNEYATLRLFKNLLDISNSFRNITHMTRYNSITSAVGPTTYDTVLSRMRDQDFERDGNITPSTKDQIREHPILQAFRDGQYDLEKKLLGRNLIQASDAINDIFNIYGDMIGKNNESFKDFGDFFMSYIMLIDNETTLHPVFDNSNERLNYLLNEFPGEVLEMKRMSEYSDNPFVQAIQVMHDYKIGQDILNINKKAVDPEDMSSGWIDLYNSNSKMAIDLANYAYLIGSFSFSPKTFISYLPNFIKQRMDNYVENVSTINHKLDSYYERMVDQFMALNLKSSNKTPIYISDSDVDASGMRTIYGRNINRGVSRARVNKTLIWVYLEEIMQNTFKITLIFPELNNKFFNIDTKNDLPLDMFKAPRKEDTIEYLLSLSLNDNEDQDQLTEEQRLAQQASDIFEETIRGSRIQLSDMYQKIGKDFSKSGLNEIRKKSNMEVLQAVDFENTAIQHAFEWFFQAAEKSIRLGTMSQYELNRLISDTTEEVKKYCLHY